MTVSADATKNSAAHELVALGPFITSRVWTGLWQLSSQAWGSAPLHKIEQAMQSHFDAGYTAFGKLSFCQSARPLLTQISFRHMMNRYADHYGSAELIFGQFRASLPDPKRVIGATKWCIFRNITPTEENVRAAVEERLFRMQTERVDLLQFHWNDYKDKGYMTALQLLHRLRDEGLIAALGLCNFDSVRTDEICTQLGPGVIVSNQVQFSIIDTRPLHGMADVCQRHGLKILAYGTLCGGFLSDDWLGKQQPDLYGSERPLTPSQRKYLDVILGAWGTWELFQRLLSTLRAIADRHGRSISNVAIRWVLDHSFVGAVLIGARLGLSQHVDDNQRVFGFHLTDQDHADVEAVLALSKSRTIITTIGDCGAEYRNPHGHD
ncbi:hypothetical protein AX16_001834 [Volvariella volvacea WC 439]|nr:hypothetical protein AX16_001834 [Volvariella volvacea WC 439]